MKEKYPKDYHNYVFKGDELIGDFENMYRHSAEIPWHQDKTAYKIFSDIDIVILRQHHYESILDVGCGLGYFTERLHKELSNSKGLRPVVTGIDISPTAIKNATNRFKDVDFRVADIQKKGLNKQFDLVVCKDLMWYVFPKLEHIIKNLGEMIKPGGCLYISQIFPETENYVGKEVISSPHHLKEIFGRDFHIRYYCIERDSDYNNRPHLCLLVEKSIGVDR